MAIPFKSPTPRHQDVMVLYSDGLADDLTVLVLQRLHPST